MRKSRSLTMIAIWASLAIDLSAFHPGSWEFIEERTCPLDYPWGMFVDPACLSQRIAFYNLYSVGSSMGMCEKYGSLGFFYHPTICPCSTRPVFDLAAHYIDDGTFGASVGTGLRFLNREGTTFGGINLFYDYREGTVHSFQQVGVGIEIVGNRFEMRANGYFPIGVKEATGSTTLFNDYDNSGTTTPYQVSVFKEEFAFTAFDAETGMKCCCDGFTLYGAVGFYYFQHRPFNSDLGARCRLRVDYHQWITFDGELSWDECSEGAARAQIEFTLPLSLFCDLSTLFCPPCRSQERIRRDGPIHIGDCCHYMTNY